MSVLLAVAVVATIAAPHTLALERAPAGLAAIVWLGALVLRALTAMFCAVFVLLFFPATQVFSAITHWCWHAVIPLIATHLPLDGHAVGDVALVMPAFVLAGSTLSVSLGLWKAARRVRRLLARAVVGPGPGESLLLADGDVLVAAAGLRRPRVVVSAGALLSFDDEELAASLEHERGHIARRHRYALVIAELCRALARFLPGTRVAARELTFHLERDADRYAVARTNNPAALVTAICKASHSALLGAPALDLAGGVTSRRVRLLLDGPPIPRRQDRLLRALATAMLTLVVAGAITLPAAAHAGLHVADAPRPPHHCPA